MHLLLRGLSGLLAGTIVGIFSSPALAVQHAFLAQPHAFGMVAVPVITQTNTFVGDCLNPSIHEGVCVWAVWSYSGSHADGFGFVGANGSGWGKETHPFSAPSYGHISGNTIEYPFNSGCGTSSQYDSYVKVWVYVNYEGRQLESVNSPTIHLAC